MMVTAANLVRLNVERRKINADDYRFRAAKESDCRALITQPTLVYAGGQLKIAYCRLGSEASLPSLMAALDCLEFRTDNRTDGLMSTSLTFGSLPRNTIRRDFCTPTAMARQNPDEHARICLIAPLVSSFYQQFNPELYEKHLAITREKVRPEWVIPGSPFTSGIANKNNQLNYHFDSGNYKDVWSGMIVLKRDVQGGYLAVPEFNLAFELTHGTLILFDGQKLLHGVTPIKKLKPTGVRYSLVFYSLQQMWNCLSPQEEHSRIAKLRTERTRKRVHIMRNLPVDMNADVQWPIYVPSKGRARRATMIYVLKTSGLKFKIVVEPQDLAMYREAHPDLAPEDFLVLPANDQGIVFARQFILDHARASGSLYYWQIDDNIQGFKFAQDKQTYPITVRAALSGVEKLVDSLPIKPALAATDYQQFAALADKSVSFNTRTYCCVLTRTTTGINYRHAGRLDTKEDVDFTIQHLDAGYLTVLSHTFAMEKPVMGRNASGGLAEQYKAGQHQKAARLLQTLWPRHVKLTRKKLGFDAQVVWANFDNQKDNQKDK